MENTQNYVAVRIDSAFWLFWKLPYELFPNPDCPSLFTPLIFSLCSVKYTASDELVECISKTASCEPYLKFLLSIEHSITKVYFIYTLIKCLLFLSFIYFAYIGCMDGIYFDPLQAALEIVLGVLCVIFIRISGYLFLWYLVRIEQRFNKKSSEDVALMRIFNGTFIVGEKCFWVQVDVAGSMVSMHRD